MKSSIKQILDEAHRLILEEGWIQKSYRDDKGRCLSGALADAAHRFCYFRAEYEEARSLVMTRIQSDCIPQWNDKGKRTKEEVLKALTTK